MQTFALKSRYRIEIETKVWDSEKGQWTTKPLAKPRFIENPSQDLDPAQKRFLDHYASLLAENIHLDANQRRALEEREEAGPLDCVYFHFQLLEIFYPTEFKKVEDNPAGRQLMKYVWGLVDEYNGGLAWAIFEEKVERWYAFMSEKLEAKKGPPHAS